MLLPHTLPQTIAYSRLLSDSYRRITGNHLVEAADDAALARALYEAPFVLVSHDTQADPVFRYANLAAQELWGYDWDEFTCLPSRLSAEAPLREERERLLAEAKRQATMKAIENISFIESSDCSELSENTFCFVHSYIVFQHIPETKGYFIVDRLLASLRSGGVGVLHLTFSNKNFWYWKIIRNIPFNKQLRNFFQGLPLSTPRMQMNEYDLNLVMKKLWSHGVSNCYMEFSDHGVVGVTLYFKKA